MSGKYEGLQSYVKDKNNLAVYIPCTAHSFNLVGVYSVDCCIEAVSFFGFVQMLYNFFSCSIHCWKILTEKLEKNSKNQLSVLKSLSNTRWSSHFDACNALIKNYNTIINVLEFICDSNIENGDTRRDAKILLKSILKKETGYLAILWNDILERTNKTSVELQSKMIDPLKAFNLLISLKNYVASLRDLYNTYENQTTKLSLKLKKHFKNEDNERQIKRKCTSGSQNSTQLKGIDKFRVETHIMIVNKFVTELDKRITAYNYVSQHFLFITKLNIQPDNDINLSLDNFITMYKDDIEPSIKNELVQFREYWNLSKPPFDASNVIYCATFLVPNGAHFNYLPQGPLFYKSGPAYNSLTSIKRMSEHFTCNGLLIR
ncbi:uncharacterized protein LOC112680263 [Sipha flava]|uniref:Uncharacterized protein LOC112680263 n=1 Tax=Sipha flava TaxID=143950 RepID=A0A8B8F5J6_9HEMI|nr:uncharacterized protein LOC112680263 [Sipha flava]